MKKTIKLIPAIVMLLVSAILVSTSTYAWFSMNNRVTVTGMTITTKVSNNLWIAAADGSAKDGNEEAKYVTGINQTVTGLLEPVSTVNGLAYFYNSTTNTQTTGAVITPATYTAYDPDSTTAFNTNYGTTGAVGYVDYAFYIKATNAGTAPAYLNTTYCNLLYKGSPLGTTTGVEDRAWRVAVFVQSATKETAQTTALNASTDLKTIIAPADATYFTAGKAVHAADAAVSQNVQNLGAKATIGTVAAGATSYFKVTVRLWLEGEDNRCKNDTYANLTEDYTLDLEFKLGNSDAGTQLISSTGRATATAAAAVGTVTGLETILTDESDTIASYQWYQVVNGAVDTAATGASATTEEYTATETGSYYCVVTTNRNTTYRTNVVNLTVTP